MAERILLVASAIIALLCITGVFVIQYAILRVRRDRQRSVRTPLIVALLLGAIALGAAVATLFFALRS